MFRGARLDGRWQATERRYVFPEIPVGLLGEVSNGNIALCYTRVDFIVDVGDVAHITDMLFTVDVAQQPVQHIEYDDGTRVANVSKVINRRPTHVHSHARWVDRDKYPLFARQCIVEPEFHSNDTCRPRWPGVLLSQH